MTQMKEIETFAFLDIEVSGLPVYNFGKTSIAEISIQTCSRQDLVECNKDEIPRCLNKLVLCFNPSKMIHPRSTAFSGLDNYMLEDHNMFNENAADLIINFFNHLRQPVCLVAHNGNEHDYPIINNTFQKLKKILPEGILCIDSLPAFKYIDGENKQNKFFDNTENLAQEIDIENNKKFHRIPEGEYATIFNKEHDTLGSPKRRELPQNICIDSFPASKSIDTINQQKNSEDLTQKDLKSDKIFQQMLQEEYADIIRKERDALASAKCNLLSENICIDSLPPSKSIDKINQQKNSENLFQKDFKNDEKLQQMLQEEYADIIRKERDALASPKHKLLSGDMCIDSLPPSKSIDTINQQKNSENLTQKDLESDKIFQQMLQEEYADIISKERDALATPNCREINLSTDSTVATDVFDEIINWKNINETTPQRPIVQKVHILRNSDKFICKEKKTINPKRQLFPSKGPTTRPKNIRKPYALTSVYEKCFGKSPRTAHHAEDDVTTLLKAAVFHGEEFVKYSQLYAKPISSIPALGSKS